MNDDDWVEVFMNVFKGATRPICAFIKSGCNRWVAKSGSPENEL